MGVIENADDFYSLCQLIGEGAAVTFRYGGCGWYHVEVFRYHSDRENEEHTSSGKSVHEALRRAVKGIWDVEEDR